MLNVNIGVIMKIEINNLTTEKIKEIDSISLVLEKAIELEQLDEVIFNVIIVDNDYIHTLNKTYRKIDRETDVITFALEDEKEMIRVEGVRILGDIYISIEKAKSQAEEYNHSLKRELAFLAVHGFYHLLGYDHQTKEDEEKMFQKQEEVLKSCNIERR